MTAQVIPFPSGNPSPGGERGGACLDLDLLSELKELLDGVGRFASASEAHRAVMGTLSAAGFSCQSEVPVKDRGDGSSGKVDIVARRGDDRVAIEVDRKSPRKKSVIKLAQTSALKVIVLREPGYEGKPDGIDGIICLHSNARERNIVWDACVEALGYEPLTVTEKALWGKMTSSLRSAGADSTKILSVAEWYRRHWPTVDLTITALEKWYSHFLMMAEGRKVAKAKQAMFCDYCGDRSGGHSDDCPRPER